MKNLPTYSLIVVVVLLNIGFILLKIFKVDVSQPAWLPWVFILNGCLINIIILYLLYREISKVREHLNIPGLNRPNRTPFQPGFAPIEEQVRLSVADALKSEAIDNSDKLLSSIQRKLVRIEKAIGFKSHPESLSPSDQSPTLQETLTSIDKKLDQYLSQLQTISQINPSHQTDFKLLERRVEDLETHRLGVIPLNVSAYASSSQTENLPSENQAINVTQEVAPPQDGLNLGISSQLQEIINQFNHQRPELFNDFPATPLTLTSDSIQGKVGMNARRIVQLEVPADPSQATYLKFDLDNTAWLIPNIKSPYITKIMRNLSENPEIFVISHGSGSELTLIKPAQLKPISSELWEIEEPGEFQG